MNSELELITEALIKGQANRVKVLTEIAIDQGIEPLVLLENALVPGMQVIGRRFRDNLIYISDVLIASRAMHAGLHVLKPRLSASQQLQRGKVVIGTMAGDLHDIGKNLVVMVLRGASMDVIDLGVDVEPEDFAKAVVDYQPDILGMSAMLTTTLSMIPETIKELERRNLRNSVKVMIGGNPVTMEFAHVARADGFADGAMEAVDLAQKLLRDSGSAVS